MDAARPAGRDDARTAGGISDHLIQRAYDSDSLTKGALIFFLVGLLVTAVAFIAWHRSIDGAARDLQLDPEVSRGWVIWGWIVPFVSLVMPFRSLRDLATRLGSTATSRVLVLWWLTFLFSTVVLRFSFHSSDQADDISTYRTQDTVTLVCCAVQVISAVLAFYVVVQLSRSSRERLLEAAVTPPEASAAG